MHGGMDFVQVGRGAGVLGGVHWTKEMRTATKVRAMMCDCLFE